MFDSIRLTDMRQGMFSNNSHVGIDAPYAVGKPAPPPCYKFYTTSKNSSKTYLQSKPTTMWRKNSFFSICNVKTVSLTVVCLFHALIKIWNFTHCCKNGKNSSPDEMTAATEW